MQKWEYCIVRYVSRQIYLYKDGKETKVSFGSGTMFLTITDLLNKLGLEGWEVTGQAESGEGQYSIAWTLKRPIQ